MDEMNVVGLEAADPYAEQYNGVLLKEKGEHSWDNHLNESDVVGNGLDDEDTSMDLNGNNQRYTAVAILSQLGADSVLTKAIESLPKLRHNLLLSTVEKIMQITERHIAEDDVRSLRSWELGLSIFCLETAKRVVQLLLRLHIQESQNLQTHIKYYQEKLNLKDGLFVHSEASYVPDAETLRPENCVLFPFQDKKDVIPDVVMQDLTTWSKDTVGEDGKGLSPASDNNNNNYSNNQESSWGLFGSGRLSDKDKLDGLRKLEQQYAMWIGCLYRRLAELMSVKNFESGVQSFVSCVQCLYVRGVGNVASKTPRQLLEVIKESLEDMDDMPEIFRQDLLPLRKPTHWGKHWGKYTTAALIGGAGGLVGYKQGPQTRSAFQKVRSRVLGFLQDNVWRPVTNFASEQVNNLGDTGREAGRVALVVMLGSALASVRNISFRASPTERLRNVRSHLSGVLGALDHLMVCFRMESSVLSPFLEQRMLGDVNDLSMKSSKSFSSSVASSAINARLNDAEDKLLGFLILYTKQLEFHARHLPEEFAVQQALVEKLAVSLRSVRISLSNRKEILTSLHQVLSELRY